MASDEEPKVSAADALESLNQVLEAQAMLTETAVGYRRQLEAAGWSPENAENISTALLIELIKATYRNVG